MTVSYVDVGALFGTGTTSATVTGTNIPAGSGGGLLFLVPFANSLEEVPTPSDASAVLIGSGYGGVATTFAEDAGRRGAAAFFCEDGSKTTMQFTQPAGSGGSVISALAIRVSKSLSYWATHSAVPVYDTAAGANFSGTATSNPGTAVGDLVFVIGSTIPSATSIGFSMVWTGSGITSMTSTRTGQNTSGFNIRHNAYRAAPTGVASANPTVNGTVDETGTALVVVLRDTNTPPTPPSPWRRRQSGLWVEQPRLRRQGGAWV